MGHCAGFLFFCYLKDFICFYQAAKFFLRFDVVLLMDTISSKLDLIVPDRFGDLLSAARLSSGISLYELSSCSTFSSSELVQYEHGLLELDEISVASLMALYGIEAGEMIPQRSQLIIDLDGRKLEVASRSVKLSRSGSSDDVLTRYLALVYKMRKIDPSVEIPLRTNDLDVLSEALLTRRYDVEKQLVNLMNDGTLLKRRSRILNKKLLLPAAGVVVASVSAGSLLLIQTDVSQQPAEPSVPPVSTVEAQVSDTPVVISRSDSGVIVVESGS